MFKYGGKVRSFYGNKMHRIIRMEWLLIACDRCEDMDQQNCAVACFDGVRDVRFDGLNVARAEGAPFAVYGEVGLALEAVDRDGPGGGVDGDLAAVTQVEEEYLPTRTLGQQPSLLGLRRG